MEVLPDSLTGGASLSDMEAADEVRALIAQIGGQLVLARATLRNTGEIALRLDGAEIAGDVFLERLQATGDVRAPSAGVGGQLVLPGAKLSK